MNHKRKPLQSIITTAGIIVGVCTHGMNQEKLKLEKTLEEKHLNLGKIKNNSWLTQKTHSNGEMYMDSKYK